MPSRCRSRRFTDDTTTLSTPSLDSRSAWRRSRWLCRLPLGFRAGYLADKFDLRGTVRSSVVAEHFVEPDCRLAIHIRLLPRVPRQVRLRLSRNQAPVDGAYVVFFRDGQDALERAVVTARHVLGANERATVLLERLHPLFEFGRRVIAVERRHIRLVELNLGHLA